MDNTRVQLYISGRHYDSRFNAGIESGLSAVGIWKGLKRSNGDPVLIKNQIVITESWLNKQKKIMEAEYGAQLFN